MDSNEFDFGKMFEDREAVRTNIRTGEKVRGEVIMIDDTSVFVDLHSRCDGVIDRLDLTDAKGNLTVKVGDTVEAYNMGLSNEGFRLQIRMADGPQVDGAVADAFAAKMPIEGKVTGERKGGFTVQVAATEGFCPFSQMDLRGVKKEPAEYIGNKYTFEITEYSEDGRNLVLSRRKILETEAVAARERLMATLQAGDVVEGTVTRVAPFGAFVDLGGAEGMVHVSEMSWDRGVKPEETVATGQTVQVKVLSVEWGEGEKRDRISLSMKQANENPWDAILADPDFAPGAKRHGKVVRLADFGVFINLAPGIDGLAHISQLGADHRVEHPSEVVKVGDEVDVTVLGVDGDRRRISLCIGEPKTKELKPAELTAEEEQKAAEMAVAGQTLTGEVDSIKPFGVFVKLPNGQTGLLHISQIRQDDGSPIQTRALYRDFPLHGKVEVVVRDVQGDRVSLTLPATLEMENEQKRTTAIDVKAGDDSSFGSLGDLLGGLNL